MKKIFTSVALLLMGTAAFSQQDAQFTHNMFNKLTVNPGYAGANGGICGTILSRQQWMGFEGNPQTHLFSGDAAINFLGAEHGVGLTVFQDKIGAENSFMVKLSYAYRRSLGPGKIGIGIEGGYYNKAFTADWLAIDDPNFDPAIPNSQSGDNIIDFGAGLYYHIPQKMYVGISTLHIPQSSLVEQVDGNTPTTGGSALNYLTSRHYYVMAGYYWDIEPGKWQLQPSVFAKTDAASTQVDVNALLLYNNVVWGGVSYRVQDAIAALAGVNIPQVKGLKLGVSYDVTTSAIGDHSSGSLEFMLRYCTNITKPVKREVYRSVRFL